MNEYSFSADVSFWLIFVIAAFAVTYCLRIFGLLRTERAQLRFVVVGAAVVAALFAFAADSPSTNGPVINLFGKLAIFALVWFVVGLMFAVGVALAASKTKNSDE